MSWSHHEARRGSSTERFLHPVPGHLIHARHQCRTGALTVTLGHGGHVRGGDCDTQRTCGSKLSVPSLHDARCEAILARALIRNVSMHFRGTLGLTWTSAVGYASIGCRPFPTRQGTHDIPPIFLPACAIPFFSNFMAKSAPRRSRQPARHHKWCLDGYRDLYRYRYRYAYFHRKQVKYFPSRQKMRATAAETLHR